MTRINRSLANATILLVLVLGSGAASSAQSRYYHSNNTSPFIKMMLVMMDAMGMLDRVPGYGGYGPYGYSASPYSVSPWNRYQNNPFMRSPWGNSSWGGSPWGYSGTGINSPIWGSPDWGVLPVEGYYYNNYKPYTTRWSADELSGWVKEPWEASEWNPEVSAGNLENRWLLSDSALQQRNQPAAGGESVQSASPIVQNFNLNVAEKTDGNISPVQQRQGMQTQGLQRQGRNSALDHKRRDSIDQAASQQTSSPLAKLHRPPYQAGKAQPNKPLNRQQGRQFEQRAQPTKPCITDFCGLRKPDIDGFWVAQDGEMLGIKNNRYLWSDGGTRKLSGQVKLQNEYLLMKVDGYEKLKRFKYKLAGDHLLTMQPDGKIREFIRTPGNFSGQYPAGRYGW